MPTVTIPLTMVVSADGQNCDDQTSKCRFHHEHRCVLFDASLHCGSGKQDQRCHLCRVNMLDLASPNAIV